MKMYSLSCKDMGIEKCDYVAISETKEKVIKMVTDHFIKNNMKEAKEMMEKLSEDEMKQKMMEKIVEKDENGDM